MLSFAAIAVFAAVSGAAVVRSNFQVMMEAVMPRVLTRVAARPGTSADPVLSKLAVLKPGLGHQRRWLLPAARRMVVKTAVPEDFEGLTDAEKEAIVAEHEAAFLEAVPLAAAAVNKEATALFEDFETGRLEESAFGKAEKMIERLTLDKTPYLTEKSVSRLVFIRTALVRAKENAWNRQAEARAAEGRAAFEAGLEAQGAVALFEEQVRAGRLEDSPASRIKTKHHVRLVELMEAKDAEGFETEAQAAAAGLSREMAEDGLDALRENPLAAGANAKIEAYLRQINEVELWVSILRAKGRLPSAGRVKTEESFRAVRAGLHSVRRLVDAPAAAGRTGAEKAAARLTPFRPGSSRQIAPMLEVAAYYEARMEQARKDRDPWAVAAVKREIREGSKAVPAVGVLDFNWRYGLDSFRFGRRLLAADLAESLGRGLLISLAGALLMAALFGLWPYAAGLLLAPIGVLLYKAGRRLRSAVNRYKELDWRFERLLAFSREP